MRTLDLARGYLGQRVAIVVDRPLGSNHPTHGFKYLVNYGYVPGVIAADGEELDAYVLGVAEPVTEFDGHCIAIVHRRDDDDDKLVLAPHGATFSDEEILSSVRFQEQYFDSELVRS